MSRNVSLRELLVGVEGLALLRHLYDCSDEEAAQRLREVRELLDDPALEVTEAVAEADARSGYGRWSRRYDEPGNPVIGLEQPAVWSLLEPLPAGRALDAACGTGRHARRLVGLGHDVVGIDLTPEMLAVARAAVPGAAFVQADLCGIPAPDGAFRLVVCGLALAHVASLGAAVRELARVTAVGGHVLVSVLHPFQALLGWQAPFEDEAGRRGFVREHPHTHADYLAAFDGAGLEVRHCVEPALSASEVIAKRRAFRHVPDATSAAYVGLPAVLVWDVQRRGS